MFMQNFSSLACTQTDLDKFLTIFEENFRTFQENSLASSKKFQTWVRNFILNLAKHVHAKFHPSLYPLQIFDLFQEKFKIFYKENLEFSKSKKVLNRDSQKAFLTKIWAIQHFLKIFKTDFKIFWLLSFKKNVKISKFWVWGTPIWLKWGL
jgi:hypothetical protein